jgi:hypothetical protein
LQRRQFQHAAHLASNTTGSTITSIAAFSLKPEATRNAADGTLVSRIFSLSIAH